jgi:glucokinase
MAIHRDSLGTLGGERVKGKGNNATANLLPTLPTLPTLPLPMTEPLQIGIDIGGTKMLMVAVGKDGIQARQQIDTGKQFSGRDAEMAIDRFVRSLMPVQSIGIAIPGLVDASGMTIACDVLPQLVGWQPASIFSSLCPVCVLNDAEAALVRVVADVSPKSVAIVVMVGTGIGSAISVDGRVLRGANGWAGELGSIPLDLTGVTLDSLASGAAIAQEIDVSIPIIRGMVARSNMPIPEIVDRAGSALGLGLATLINLFNPEAIVLSGGTLRYRGYLDAALASAQSFALPDLWAACNISVSPHEGDLVALGAAHAALSVRE